MGWFRRDKGSDEGATAPPAAAEQRREPLAGELLADLEAKRAWVRGFVREESLETFDGSWEFRLGTLAAILDQAGLRPDQTAELQALGVVLGDAIAAKAGGTWVEVTDEYGTDPALALGGDLDAVVFPQTMISKRIEGGETVDLETLYGLLTHAEAAAGGAPGA
ncbi:DUF3806 domain-containing protein [Patulibacter sp. S7RM1-6]